MNKYLHDLLFDKTALIVSWWTAIGEKRAAEHAMRSAIEEADKLRKSIAPIERAVEAERKARKANADEAASLRKELAEAKAQAETTTQAGQSESLKWILERAKWFSKDRCFLGASDAKHLLDIQNEANAIRMRDKASGVIASARFLAAYLIAWIEKIEARNVNEPTE